MFSTKYNKLHSTFPRGQTLEKPQMWAVPPTVLKKKQNSFTECGYITTVHTLCVLKFKFTAYKASKIILYTTMNNTEI